METSTLENSVLFIKDTEILDVRAAQIRNKKPYSFSVLIFEWNISKNKLKEVGSKFAY